MVREKIESILGFAVKAGKTVYGADSLETYKKRYFVIVMCSSTSQNTQDKVIAQSKKRNVPIIFAEKEIENLIGRKNCKVLAVTDKQMSQAMLDRLSENYHLISSEVK